MDAAKRRVQGQRYRRAGPGTAIQPVRIPILVSVGATASPPRLGLGLDSSSSPFSLAVMAEMPGSSAPVCVRASSAAMAPWRRKDFDEGGRGSIRGPRLKHVRRLGLLTNAVFLFDS